ncbi:MAG: flavodoxin-dependent (E)-4-hydroxy-3-methylbut-2-enyl-diphosphate synthase [Solobacterium sp.]|nr:flavodoxin-dependent (E)-4-hydroxy-3-methylbut-2-enyl-diphosphate synthase [Solobacterium sp.]
MKRNETRPIYVGNIQIGGQDKCIIQSMTNIPAKNIEESVRQINELDTLGCELVRTAVLDEEDARAIPLIKEKISIPLVADIHFNHKLALICLDGNIDAIRINPGNIGDKEKVEAVVNKCKEKHVPIRIGINAGSLERELLQKYGGPCVEAMIESAQKHIQILEDLDFYDICLSFKSSNVRLTIDVYQKAAEIFPYPLHLGVTEAGGFNESAVKSSAALGVLLNEGIGDTIRVSVSGPPKDELIIAKQLLRSFSLIEDVPDLISCPTCGRIQYDMLPLVKEMEEYLQTIQANITVAIMGCPVNGMQEASRADIGVAGGHEQGLLFKKGELIRTVKQEELASALKEEIEKMLKKA